MYAVKDLDYSCVSLLPGEPDGNSVVIIKSWIVFVLVFVSQSYLGSRRAYNSVLSKDDLTVAFKPSEKYSPSLNDRSGVLC